MSLLRQLSSAVNVLAGGPNATMSGYPNCSLKLPVSLKYRGSPMPLRPGSSMSSVLDLYKSFSQDLLRPSATLGPTMRCKCVNGLPSQPDATADGQLNDILDIVFYTPRSLASILMYQELAQCHGDRAAQSYATRPLSMPRATSFESRTSSINSAAAHTDASSLNGPRASNLRNENITDLANSPNVTKTGSLKGISHTDRRLEVRAVKWQCFKESSLEGRPCEPAQYRGDWVAQWCVDNALPQSALATDSSASMACERRQYFRRLATAVNAFSGEPNATTSGKPNGILDVQHILKPSVARSCR
ncbi:hypothetical protein GGG16DRAFT_118035 [Schizophyllum commune]